MRFLDQFQQINNTKLLVGPKDSVSQTFISKHNNLAGVRLLVSNANLGGNRLYNIVISHDSVILRKEVISESNIGWEMVFRFDFKPIPDSFGEKYTLTIASEEPNISVPALTTLNKYRAEVTQPNLINLPIEETSNLEKRYLNISYSTNDVYPDGKAQLENEFLPGDIAFETYYQTTLVSAIKNTIVGASLRLWSDKAFFVIYFLIIFTVCFVIFRASHMHDE